MEIGKPLQSGPWGSRTICPRRPNQLSQWSLLNPFLKHTFIWEHFLIVWGVFLLALWSSTITIMSCSEKLSSGREKKDLKNLWCHRRQLWLRNLVPVYSTPQWNYVTGQVSLKTNNFTVMTRIKLWIIALPLAYANTNKWIIPSSHKHHIHVYK